MKFKERRMQLELKRLREEWEIDCSREEGEERNQVKGARIAFGGARSLNLSHFIDGKMT